VVGRRTRDREVAGSTPAAALFGKQPSASCSHGCAENAGPENGGPIIPEGQKVENAGLENGGQYLG